MAVTNIKVSVIQLNPIVGDMSANLDKHMLHILESIANNCELIVFPEHSLTGYPLEDLVLRPDFMLRVGHYTDKLIKFIHSLPNDITVIFGAPENNPKGLPYNSAYVVSNETKTVQIVRKYQLPNYGPFDEKRTYERGSLDDVKPITVRGRKLGVLICEDLWFPEVSKKLADQQASAIISINGSPFEMGKNATRLKVASNRIAETGLPILYVNMLGGQDELFFDGGSFYLTKESLFEFDKFKESPQYDIHLNIIDKPEEHTVTSLPRRKFVKPNNDPETLYHVLVNGTRDYTLKSGFSSFTLGMSGGVDSGIVAAIACDALGPKFTHLVNMPSKFSSDGSKDDSIEAARRLGCNLETVYIEEAAECLRLMYKNATVNFDVSGKPRPRTLTGVSDENIQPRIRGTYLMAKSNQEGHLVLSTGNKSEMSVGFATLYGDMCGGLNPIKDVYKTMVRELCRYRNSMSSKELARSGFLGAETEVVPETIITKPPSAELRENQLDTDSLPPYEILDPILRYINEGEPLNIEVDFDTLIRISDLVHRAEYKRRQACPGIKTTSKQFGRDRRVPIVNKFKGFR